MPSERSAPSSGWRTVYATMDVDPDGADQKDERKPNESAAAVTASAHCRRPPAD